MCWKIVFDNRHVLFECVAAQPLLDKYHFRILSAQTHTVHAFVRQEYEWTVAEYLLDIVEVYDA